MPSVPIESLTDVEGGGPRILAESRDGCTWEGRAGRNGNGTTRANLYDGGGDKAMTLSREQWKEPLYAPKKFGLIP